MLKNQLFGVEVEMTGITRAGAAKIIAEFFWTSPSKANRNVYHTQIIKDPAGRE